MLANKTAATTHAIAARNNRLEANRVFRAARDSALTSGATVEEANKAGREAEEKWWDE